MSIFRLATVCSVCTSYYELALCISHKQDNFRTCQLILMRNQIEKAKPPSSRFKAVNKEEKEAILALRPPKKEYKEKKKKEPLVHEPKEKPAPAQPKPAEEKTKRKRNRKKKGEQSEGKEEDHAEENEKDEMMEGQE